MAVERDRTPHLCECGAHAFVAMTRGYVAMVDAADIGHLDRKWQANPQNRTVYAKRGGRKGTVYLHRLILHVQPGMEIDHVDGNGLNNSRSNLRACSHGENNAHRRKPRRALSSSRFLGVSWRRIEKKWCARLSTKVSSQHIGYFDSEHEAALAYDAAAARRFGRFAKLNFPTLNRASG